MNDHSAAADDIARRIGAVRARIAASTERVARDPASVTLVAVTKTVTVARAREAVAAGVSELGESRSQELRAKHDQVEGARWHFIGPLQRNKIAHIVGEVALIHSVESERNGAAIGRAAAERGLVQDVLLEVNVSGDPAKHGVDAGAAAAAADALGGLGGIRLRGLMTIAPQGDPAAARRTFAALREIGAVVRRSHPDASVLSMGMSDDFEVAIEEGATLVRVGTAIFGDRPSGREEPGRM